MELMSGTSRHSPEQKSKAVRMVVEATPNYPSQWAAIGSVAAKIGVSSETLRKWVRQAEVDGGQRAGLTTEEAAEIKRLRREVAEPGVSTSTIADAHRQWPASPGAIRAGPTGPASFPLRRANEILKAAAAFFGAELDRPQKSS
jgi:transposase